ncbi:hypothetical protein EON80_05925 [bacterium]|nr:MAG: hypothetical protein EON80_05925 [bacterium]
MAEVREINSPADKDEAFEELVRQAQEEAETPPLDTFWLAPIGCLGGLIGGFLFCAGAFQVLRGLDAITGYPFDLSNRDRQFFDVHTTYPLLLGILGMVAYPIFARRRRKTREPSTGSQKRVMSVAGMLLCLGLVCTGFQLRRSALNSLLPSIEKGILKPDSKGVIQLPFRLAWLSPNGKAYLTRRGDLQMVFLPTELGFHTFGKSFPTRGRLICSRPLTEKDQRQGWSGPEVKITYPFSDSFDAVGTEFVKIEHVIIGNDYYVTGRFW